MHNKDKFPVAPGYSVTLQNSESAMYVSQMHPIDYDELITNAPIDDVYEFLKFDFHKIKHNQAFDSLLTRCRRLEKTIADIKEVALRGTK